MRKIITLAVAFGASAFAAHAASPLHPGTAGAAAPSLTPAGSSDGASLPGAPGGKGGKPGKPTASGGHHYMMSEAEARRLYTYCMKLMDDAKEGKAMARDTHKTFEPSD